MQAHTQTSIHSSMRVSQFSLTVIKYPRESTLKKKSLRLMETPNFQIGGNLSALEFYWRILHQKLRIFQQQPNMANR